MVTLTALGGADGPTTVREKQQAGKACLQAAREAIDVAERKLDGLTESTERLSRASKGYQRDEYESAARFQRQAAMNELTEAVQHLAETVRVWWPHLDLATLLGPDPAA